MKLSPGEAKEELGIPGVQLLGCLEHQAGIGSLRFPHANHSAWGTRDAGASHSLGSQAVPSRWISPWDIKGENSTT